MAEGPYTLTFRVQSRAAATANSFSTTDAETSLPRAGTDSFPVTHDGQWHDVTLTIAEPETLRSSARSSCAGKGEVRNRVVATQGLEQHDAEVVALILVIASGNTNQRFRHHSTPCQDSRPEGQGRMPQRISQRRNYALPYRARDQSACRIESGKSKVPT